MARPSDVLRDHYLAIALVGAALLAIAALDVVQYHDFLRMLLYR
jgi:hypothetical protein